jgi:dCMP deaminase
MKPKLIKAYMDTAKIFAELSHARRLHVGAIVVKDDRIISIGYNGMPRGWENDCEYEEEILMSELGKGTWIEKTGNLKTKPETLHAETNAISKLARSTESGDGAVMFVTHSPCIECAKLIYQSGIKTVYYDQDYRDTLGIDFLTKSGVDVIKTK